MIKLRCGDCLELMKEIPDKSIDCIICDLPYGTTACRWDSVLPLDDLWDEYKRVIKDKGAIVLFASEPFATVLRNSCLDLYRYDWIWEKNHPSNFQLMNFQPAKIHELICVFSKGKSCYTSNHNSMMYYPQKVKRENPVFNGGGLNSCKLLHNNNMKKQFNVYTDKHPISILHFDTVAPSKRLHPTQKPLELLEYMVKTYSNEGDLVLDNCMGSGTTGVACKKLNRNFIGIEKDEEYFKKAKERIESETIQMSIFDFIGKTRDENGGV